MFFDNYVDIFKYQGPTNMIFLHMYCYIQTQKEIVTTTYYLEYLFK